jgi:hypothetical protein
MVMEHVDLRMERGYIYAIVVILVTSCILALMDNMLGNRKTCTD